MRSTYHPSLGGWGNGQMFIATLALSVKFLKIESSNLSFLLKLNI
ncbi:hypothetical protein CKA32_004475 [Geitlerinema sp. FC II]|nr:hypothetical protein CKA32_004475 [Geitlerinema sp. FC II]